ncbi:hypothetical protein ACWCQL_33145 [Streptomyces sp. NPDC002073]
MKRSTADRVVIGLNAGGVALQLALFVTGNVHPVVTAVCLAICIGPTVTPIRRQLALLSFHRSRKRADQLIGDTRQAADEVDRTIAALNQALIRTEQAARMAEKDGGLSDDEGRRLINEVSVLKERMLAAHENVTGKHAALDTITSELTELMDHVESLYSPSQGFVKKLSQSLTDVAVFLAGPENAHLSDTWRADLIGVPSEGYELSPNQRLAHACGFIFASLRIRTTVAARRAWRPVDWLLVNNQRVNAVITAVVGSMAVYLSGSGLDEFLNAAFGPCTAAYLALKAAAARLRQVRGIELHPQTEGQGSLEK